MALLMDFNVNAQRDERQDNRATSNSYSIVYNPQVAHPGGKISGNNRADSSASTDWGQESNDGFTGKNMQTVLIVGAGLAIAAGAAYIILK